MRDFRGLISNVLITIGAIFVAVSIYCFWNGRQIRQQQLQKAGDDPFVMVFTDKIQPEDARNANAEIIRLNNQRLRSENRGWFLIISGVGILIAISALKGWRRKSISLNIIDK